MQFTAVWRQRASLPLTFNYQEVTNEEPSNAFVA